MRRGYDFDLDAGGERPGGEPDDRTTSDDGGGGDGFVVSDIASIAHYRAAFGFKVSFEYGDPTFYACLCRDEVALHLTSARQTKRLPAKAGIYVFVTDVDGVHAELVANGANMLQSPQDYGNGMPTSTDRSRRTRHFGMQSSAR